jgi:3-deoxy-D-manno-octulosonic-acid transferase
VKTRRSTLFLSLILDLCYLAAAPFLLACILVASRGFTRPKYRRGLLSKLWSTPRREGSGKSFWVHAVSVGEVLTAVPLLKRLREEYGDWDVRVSVSTFTGLEVAQKQLGNLPLFYFPFDLSPVVRRFFRRHRPTAIILMELELWPNFLLEAARRGVPVLVANGRITERSALRYSRGGWLTRRFFNWVDSFGAQNEDYRQRFLRVGVDPERVEILGNLKHDRGPAPIAAKGGETRDLLGWKAGEKMVLVAGSTHPGEEALVLSTYRQLLPGWGQLRLVLVPRHVERLVEGELDRWGEKKDFLVRWSALRGASPEAAAATLGDRVLVVDTLGELELFYSLADIVFVGGSLVHHGGHNVFEASRLGKPVLFGPHIANFKEEADLLLGEKAAICVRDGEELARVVDRLLSQAGEREELGRKAREVTGRLRGATDAHIAWIERHLRGAL